MTKFQSAKSDKKTVKSEKFSLQCYISKEAYEKVQELVGDKEKPFRSTSEYLMGLVYADIGRRGAINNKILCYKCGASIDSNSRYCSVCGSPISEDAKKSQLVLDIASKNTSNKDILAILAGEIGITKEELEQRLSKK